MRRWLGPVALSASVVGALLAMELAVRATGLGLPSEPASEPPPPKPLPAEMRDLPELRDVGDLVRPDTRGVFHGVLHRTNSAGMRGPEISPRPAPGSFRIAVIGDSVTMGQGVDERETYSARVERALDAEAGGRRYEVLNLGISGMTIVHSVMRLRNVGLPHHPHLVVYGYTLNDIEGPAYVRNSRRDRQAFLALLGRHRDSPSALLRALWPRLVVLRSSWRPLPGSYEAAMERNYFRNPEAWAQVARGLDRLAAIGSSRGICVQILVHTALMHLRFAHPFTRFYDHVEAEARARGLYVVQSYPFFRGRDAARFRFDAIDRHPNAEGHRVLAEALLAGLRELPERCGLGL